MRSLKSREVYAAFDKALRPWALDNRFSSKKPGTWSRRLSATEDLVISAQVDKYGYLAWGSKFTVNFDRLAAAGNRELQPFDLPPTFTEPPRSQRVGWLLGVEDQDDLDGHHRRVIAKIDPRALDEEERGLFLGPSPGAIQSDIWFRCVDLDDVREWCVFLTDRLARLIDNFFLGLPHTRRPSPIDVDATLIGLRIEHAADWTTLVVPRHGASRLRELLESLDRAPRVAAGTAFQLLLVPSPDARYLRWEVTCFSLDPSTRMTLWPGRAQVAELVAALRSTNDEPVTLMEASRLRLQVRTG